MSGSDEKRDEVSREIVDLTELSDAEDDLVVCQVSLPKPHSHHQHHPNLMTNQSNFHNVNPNLPHHLPNFAHHSTRCEFHESIFKKKISVNEEFQNHILTF